VRVLDILHWADGIYRAADDVRALYKCRMDVSLATGLQRQEDAWAEHKPTVADRQWPEKATDLTNDMGLQ